MTRDRLRTVLLSEAAPQPWRNGGGITRDLLAWPSAVDWQLRVSVAEVARDGPFSAYPGVERWFAVVSGAGVVLRFAEGERRLGPLSDPLRFDGADAPGCSLIDGATLDLNLLVVRDGGQGRMAVARPDTAWNDGAPMRGVFTAGAATLQIGDGPGLPLPSGSLTWGLHTDAGPWRLRPEAAPLRAWWLAFQPRTP